MEPEPIAPLAPSPTAAAGPSQQPPEQSEPREQEALPTPAGPSTTTRAAPAEAPEGKAIDLKVDPLSVIELSLLIPMDGQAEADYLRRLNARNPTTTSRGSGKDNDLFGKEALESQMNSLVKEQGLTFDQDALTYLALAAESRLRSVLASTLSAQTHRTTTSHARTPPFTSSGKKPLWSHSVTSDPNAVLAAMAQANKEATQKYRAARVAEKNRLTLNQPFQSQADDSLSDSNNDPSTPMKSGSSGPSTPAAASGERSSAPVFGAVKNKISSGKKKAPPPVKDLSADVQLKMSNATAMRSIGMSGRKQYSWMTSAPSISSPLANQGKKRKAGAGPSENTPEPPEAGESPAPTHMDTIRKEHGDKRKKVKRPKLSAPTRREVVVSRDEKGEEKKVSDDRAVTLVDLLFALEKDGAGRGIGKTDDLVRKAWVLGGIEASKSETKSAHKR